jgi:hypothetical protein
MTSSSNNSSGKWQGAATKTVLVSAIAGALGGVTSDAQAWWFFCKQDCEERSDQRYNYSATQCEATRQEADRNCNSSYETGSSAHQECKTAANDAEVACLDHPAVVRDWEKEEICSGMYDCSSG